MGIPVSLVDGLCAEIIFVSLVYWAWIRGDLWKLGRCWCTLYWCDILLGLALIQCTEVLCKSRCTMYRGYLCKSSICTMYRGYLCKFRCTMYRVYVSNFRCYSMTRD
jgi:hypothetical protein